MTTQNIQQQNLTDLELISQAYERIKDRTSGHINFADLGLPGYVDSPKDSLISNYRSSKKRNLLIKISEIK